MRSFSDLRYFCEHIVKIYGSPANASEDDIAQEFRSIYLKNVSLDIRTLRAVASACGIRVNGIDSKVFPSNIRGYHDVYEDNRNIYYKKGDTRSGIENTILHEFREMIEPVFGEVNPGYSPLRTNAVHLAANKFATAVLLPRNEFRERVYESGFDVVYLSRHYSKSCSQVLLRMGEVLQGEVFFYGALYEIDAENNEWKLNYWTGSANNDDLDANVNGVDGLFPKKGRLVEPGSLVDMTIHRKRSHIVERIILTQGRDDDGLVAIARPIIISGAVVKVALIVLLEFNRDLINSQIERAKPVVIEEFHRHL